jgi:Protein of unknown function (DUF3179)
VKVKNLLGNPLSGLLLCLGLAFLLLTYPVYVIRPFRYQGPHELSLALALMRVRWVLDVALTGAAIFLFIRLWRAHTRWVPRISAAVCTLLVAGCAWLSRVNIYELMFKPLDRISFSPASQSKLDKDEEVITVKVGSVARAYPVRSMSYHHIVNDVLAGEPIVATY